MKIFDGKIVLGNKFGIKNFGEYKVGIFFLILDYYCFICCLSIYVF